MIEFAPIILAPLFLIGLLMLICLPNRPKRARARIIGLKSDAIETPPETLQANWDKLRTYLTQFPSGHLVVWLNGVDLDHSSDCQMIAGVIAAELRSRGLPIGGVDFEKGDTFYGATCAHELADLMIKLSETKAKTVDELLEEMSAAMRDLASRWHGGFRERGEAS